MKYIYIYIERDLYTGDFGYSGTCVARTKSLVRQWHITTLLKEPRRVALVIDKYHPSQTLVGAFPFLIQFIALRIWVSEILTSEVHLSMHPSTLNRKSKKTCRILSVLSRFSLDCCFTVTDYISSTYRSIRLNVSSSRSLCSCASLLICFCSYECNQVIVLHETRWNTKIKWNPLHQPLLIHMRLSTCIGPLRRPVSVCYPLIHQRNPDAGGCAFSRYR